jgi:hypothetical protein
MIEPDSRTAPWAVARNRIRRRPTKPARPAAAVDLTEADLAAINASEMTPGFEHLDAELEPEPAFLVEEGVRFARELGERGEKTEGRPADKTFRDSLYDDG